MAEEQLSAVERLALLESERAKKRARRDAEEAETIAARKLRALEQFDQLEEKYGEVKLVDTLLGPVVLRKPNQGEYKIFRSGCHDDKKKPLAVEQLVRRVRVYPSAEEFSQMLEDKPGIADKCADAALELAGVTGEDISKG